MNPSKSKKPRCTLLQLRSETNIIGDATFRAVFGIRSTTIRRKTFREVGIEQANYIDRALIFAYVVSKRVSTRTCLLQIAIQLQAPLANPSRMTFSPLLRVIRALITRSHIRN